MLETKCESSAGMLISIAVSSTVKYDVKCKCRICSNTLSFSSSTLIYILSRFDFQTKKGSYYLEDPLELNQANEGA